MIFESHAHYDDKAFLEDRSELVSLLVEHNISYVINVSADDKSLKNTKEMMELYPHVYGAFGIHPNEVGNMNESILRQIREYSSLEKAVAIGEVGLDYYWPEPAKELQYKWFCSQLDLAKEINKPVIIHSRDAAKDTLDILKQEQYKDIQGVIHCYSYSKESAKEFLELGYYFGIGGVVTYSNAKKLQEAVKYIPLDHILVETDCPYLSPVPVRGKRNSSLNLPYIIEKIAMIKNMDSMEVEEATFKNAKKLFNMI